MHSGKDHPRGFDVIGDIAIVSIPELSSKKRSDIVDSVITSRANIHTVLNKITKLEGERRVAGFEVLAGDSTVTTHSEFGLRYRMDLSRVFFNGRLGYERHRVASNVMQGEKVLVPFCGVGPFAIPAAVKGAFVVGVEKNPDACKWSKENVRLNHVEGNMEVILMDALHLGKMFTGTFDRIIIPTPYGFDSFLKIAVPIVKIGGHIHFYTFKKKFQIPGLIKQYHQMGLGVKFYRRCGNVAPGVSRWVFDMVRV